MRVLIRFYRFLITISMQVSLDDFMGTVAAEPLLIEAFGQCLPTDSAVVSFFSTLQV